MNRFNFWQKWLFVLGILVCLGGVSFSLSSFTDFEFTDINSVFWEGGVVPYDAKEFQNWIYGVCFSLTAAFGLFIVFIANNPFKKKEKWSWNCLVTCISMWFVIETFFSIYYKVYPIAFNNIFQFVLLMLPLIFTRKEFAS